MVGHHHSAGTSSSQDKGSQPMGQGDKRATAGKEEGKAICVATTSSGAVRRNKARSKCQYMKRQRSPKQRARCKSKGRDGRAKAEAILNVWETIL